MDTDNRTELLLPVYIKLDEIKNIGALKGLDFEIYMVPEKCGVHFME